MGQTARIALTASVGGMLVAAALVAARSPAPEAEGISAPDKAAVMRSAPLPTRCRTIAQADRACEAAWEARRAHFFGADAGGRP